jgi:hypothetical protein
MSAVDIGSMEPLSRAMKACGDFALFCRPTSPRRKKSRAAARGSTRDRQRGDRTVARCDLTRLLTSFQYERGGCQHSSSEGPGVARSEREADHAISLVVPRRGVSDGRSRCRPVSGPGRGVPTVPMAEQPRLRVAA